MKEQHGFTREQHGPDTGRQGIRRFGNYDLVRRIDVGGMGEVYLARQRTAFGREVALKIIRSDLMHDITARKRFLREAEVNAYLKHDHILPLVEFGEEQGRLFLVTPYIKGGTLGKRLQDGPLSLSEVHQLFTALLQAVAYLHKRGVIHRDLKPSNILLDREEDSDRVYVRLIDFGIASLQGVSTSGPLTSAGHELGTAAYMAPERREGIAAPSNDIYSLGVILYQMLAGHLPDTGEAVALAKPLDYIVQRCTAADPAERFVSADELLKAFEHAFHVLAQHPQVERRGQEEVMPSEPAHVDHPLEKNSPQPGDSVLEKETKPSAEVGTATSVVSSQSTAPEPVVMPAALAAELPPAAEEDAITIRRHTKLRPVARATLKHTAPPPEVTLPPLPDRRSGPSEDVRNARSGEMILPAPLGRGSGFSGDDYNAPTTYLDPEHLQTRRGKRKRGGSQKPVQAAGRKKPKRSLVATISLCIVILMAVLGVLAYMGLQASITANVSVSPRVRQVSNVFTVTAKIGQQSIDASTASIPANVLTSTKQASQQGKTTGSSGCFFIFDCKQTVSVLDITTLSAQILPNLRTQIEQDLRKQASAAGATTVGNIVYTNDNVTSDPPVGGEGKTVTVMLSEQGNLEYIKAKDVHDLALQLLGQKLATNYTLIDQLTQIGQPVVQGVNANGEVRILIAAGGIARYQFSSDDLAAIQDHIKGMKVKDARAYIAKQANLDPNVISIHLSYGDTLPGNAGQIKMTTLDPIDLPQVQLTPVPTAASGG